MDYNLKKMGADIIFICTDKTWELARVRESAQTNCQPHNMATKSRNHPTNNELKENKQLRKMLPVDEASTPQNPFLISQTKKKKG